MAGRKDMPPGPGRPKGSVNKATSDAREAIAEFVNNNVDRLETWLDAIAEDDPEAAFKAYMSVIEYHIPKLARSEHTGKDGSAIEFSMKRHYSSEDIEHLRRYFQTNPQPEGE